MFEVFMMIGVVCYAIGFGFLQFAFLRWLFKNDSFWVFGVALCMLIGCDCLMIGCLLGEIV